MISHSSVPALRVAGLRKAYGDVVAVDGLDLTVAAGECFGLLGPNGAGKTTTIEICEGLTEPDTGEVEVLGRRWDREGVFSAVAGGSRGDRPPPSHRAPRSGRLGKTTDGDPRPGRVGQ